LYTFSSLLAPALITRILLLANECLMPVLERILWIKNGGLANNYQFWRRPVVDPASRPDAGVN